MDASLLVNMLRGVANKAAGTLVQSVISMWGMDDDREKLERQLLAVQRKLAGAGLNSKTDQYIKRWMKDFRAVAYKADNILDDFHYEALRREAQIGNSKTSKLLSHFTSHNPLLFRLTMSIKLRDVLNKINALVEEMNKFSLVENCAEVPRVLYQQTHAALDESARIFGRDDDKEVVVKLLLDQQDQHMVQVLPIFGMGGLGKTTLARMVYNDHVVQQHFQLNMWHCVSENFEAVALLKSAIDQLATDEKCEQLPDTIELLRKRLQEIVGQKRFLFVLDDVWNEDKRKWEDDLKPLLCSVGGRGSVILVTCRSQQVASIMATLKPNELACLDEDDSWQLFSKRAFSEGVEELEDFVTVGRSIVKKCRGLPLALKVMGDLMSSKQHVQEWQAIEESNIGDDLGGKNEILSILKLSYEHLTPEMQQCVAFCAVFPKGYQMQKDILIQLWMANGFIQEVRTMDVVQKGEFIYHDLVRRSFLQEEPYSEFRIDRSIGCRMHDLMHDLVKDVTDECATIEELIQHKASIKDVCHMTIFEYASEEIRGLSMGDVSQVTVFEAGLEKISGLFKAISPRTLLAPGTPLIEFKESQLTSLRALQCGSLFFHGQGIASAKHLRYLDLSGSGIVRLPDSVCMLYNLQSLRLNGCYFLEQLPEVMSSMRKLIHLLLFKCCCLQRMPPNISLLNNLHTLTTFIVDTGDGRGIEELKDLQHLSNMLELWNLEKIKSVSSANEANLHKKQNLTGLHMHWSYETYVMPEDEVCNEEQVLESLAPHSKLKILVVDGYGGREISQWMREPQMFQCLRKLTIANCLRCKNIPIVWLSVSLEYLQLQNLPNVTVVCNNLAVEGQEHGYPLQFFPKLKEMVCNSMTSLERWTEHSAAGPDSLVTFPMLEELIIDNCPKLVSVPDCPVLKILRIEKCCSLPISSLTHLTALSDLTYIREGIVSTNSLENWMIVALDDQQSQRPLENLQSLILEGRNCFVTIPELSFLESYLGIWKCFAFVRELTINRCDDLVCWPAKEFQSLVCLRSLRIDDCSKLEGNVCGMSSSEALLLPQLENLTIVYCARLLEIPKLPASLVKLVISWCKSLVGLPSSLANLAKLTLISLCNCPGLKALSDGMDGLTSLEQLYIYDCPRIEKFPQGLIQRLPALECLLVQGCPDLQRRFREGGEYFDFVSSIPHKHAQGNRITDSGGSAMPTVSTTEAAETEPNKRNILKRLLPMCADSN